MMGTPANENPRAFWNADLEEAAAHAVAVVRELRPQVVVTYDENGAYGHPDHIQAHRIAVAAAKLTGIPRKLYYTAVPRSEVRALIERLRANGEDFGGGEPPADFGTPDELITTVVDVMAYTERKRKALLAHASQGENIGFLRMPEEIQRQVFGRESFVRVETAVEAPDREDDLFAGLR
jgi:LmbE family N-acetylglucosaminyl deacetylase